MNKLTNEEKIILSELIVLDIQRLENNISYATKINKKHLKQQIRKLEVIHGKL